MEHNIEPEEKLIRLLGYSVKVWYNSNRWIIYDENDLEVGFIQYKKLHSKNVKKGIPATFGYVLNIDSPIIQCQNIREVDSEESSLETTFSMDIKRENKEDQVEINFGNYSSFALWSKEFGYMMFKIDDNALYLNFKSKTENFELEETVLLEKGKKYGYTINYSNKDKLETVDTLNIDVSKKDDSNSNLIVVQREFRDNIIVGSNNSLVEGTMSDAIKGHEMGIEAFSHFRYLINEILPFKGDVVDTLIEGRTLIEEYDLIINGNIKKRKRTNE